MARRWGMGAPSLALTRASCLAECSNSITQLDSATNSTSFQLTVGSIDEQCTQRVAAPPGMVLRVQVTTGRFYTDSRCYYAAYEEFNLNDRHQAEPWALTRTACTTARLHEVHESFTSSMAFRLSGTLYSRRNGLDVHVTAVMRTLSQRAVAPAAHDAVPPPSPASQPTAARMLLDAFSPLLGPDQPIPFGVNASVGKPYTLFLLHNVSGARVPLASGQVPATNLSVLQHTIGAADMRANISALNASVADAFSFGVRVDGEEAVSHLYTSSLTLSVHGLLPNTLLDFKKSVHLRVVSQGCSACRYFDNTISILLASDLLPHRAFELRYNGEIEPGFNASIPHSIRFSRYATLSPLGLSETVVDRTSSLPDIAGTDITFSLYTRCFYSPSPPQRLTSVGPLVMARGACWSGARGSPALNRPLPSATHGRTAPPSPCGQPRAYASCPSTDFPVSPTPRRPLRLLQ